MTSFTLLMVICAILAAALLVAVIKLLNNQKIAAENEAQLNSQLQSINLQLSHETERTASLEKTLHESKEKTQETEKELLETAESFQLLNTEFQVQQAHLMKERQAHEEKLKLLEESKASMAKEFELLANKLLEQKSKSLQSSQNEFFTQNLTPLKDQLKEFRQRMDKMHDTETRDRVSLLSELEQLKTLNQKMSADAINLTNALKGNQKFQGNWGELVLERVLEMSGLRKGYEYDVQMSFKDDEGKTKLPDVIVQLPDNKQLVVDSKVSLTDYQRYCESDNEAEKAHYLVQHVQSLKSHIKGLSGKSYDSLEGITTLDFVLLFVPVEAAFLVALDTHPEIFQQAYDQHIILVSPTTLLATLRTVENMWRYERQNQNAERIAKEAGGLYDQFVLLTESLDDVGKAIDKTQQSYEQAKKRLVDGRGNVVRRIEGLKKLGAKTKKQLNDKLKQEAQLDEALDDIELEALAAPEGADESASQD